MADEALRTDSWDDLDPALVHGIEETILFGSIAEIDALLDRMTDDVRVPDELRYGLESLRYFRTHYAEEAGKLSDTSRHDVIKLDAEWTMRLIQKLHQQYLGTVEDAKLA